MEFAKTERASVQVDMAGPIVTSNYAMWIVVRMVTVWMAPANAIRDGKVSLAITSKPEGLSGCTMSKKHACQALQPLLA
jgi:hypothetical protein